MFIIALISSFSSVLVHGYLALQHYQLKAGVHTGTSLCNISATFNCDSVSLSKYATFLSVPMAVWGMFANLLLFVLILIAYFSLSRSPSRTARYAYYLSLLVAVTSLIMGSISTFLLDTYCLFCIATYVLSFVSAYSLWKVIESGSLSLDFKELFFSNRWVLFLGISTLALSALAHNILHDSFFPAQLKIIAVENIENWKQAPSASLDPTRGLTLKAKTKLRFQIVEFADFLCPHCKHAGPTLEAFISTRPDAELIFKFFPLDGTCNAAIEHKGDGVRCQLAYSVYCAEKLYNKGWDTNHWIFKNQERFFRGNYANLSDEMQKALNLSTQEFKTCLTSDDAHSAVLAQAKEGQDANIQGTPAIFINGKKLDGGQYYPILESAYQQVPN